MMSLWALSFQKPTSIADHTTSTTPTDGVDGKIAAFPGYNVEHFQLISKIHYLLGGQKRKIDEKLSNTSLGKSRMSLVTKILNRRELLNLNQKEDPPQGSTGEGGFNITKALMGQKSVVSFYTDTVSTLNEKWYFSAH